MPIRVHVSQLSDEDLLAKLGVKRRAKPRELERPHQVALIKWVRTVRIFIQFSNSSTPCPMAEIGAFVLENSSKLSTRHLSFPGN